MPIYEYERADGAIFEIIVPMKADKPEALYVENPADSCSAWRAATAQDDPAAIFRRKWACRMSSPVVEEYGINWGSGKLPVSHSMSARQDPYTLVKRGGHTVRQHRDGTYSDERGRPIVTNKREAEQHCAVTGCRRVKKTEL